MGLLTILSWIVFGLIVGAIARLMVPGPQDLGILGTCVLGVAGSFMGGFLKFLIFGGAVLQPSGILMSILGGMLTILIGRQLLSSSRRRHTL